MADKRYIEVGELIEVLQECESHALHCASHPNDQFEARDASNAFTTYFVLRQKLSERFPA